MINRNYFMAAEKFHGDGQGSYTFKSVTLDYASWFADPDKVFEDTAKYMEEEMRDSPGGKVQIIAFNRV